MDIKKQFGTDKSKEESGVWIETGEKSKLLIARLGNKSYMAAIKRLTQPHQVKLRNKNLPKELSDKISIEALAETVLLGWEGIEEDGKKLTYSKDEAIRLLTKYPDFSDEVVFIANDIKNFQDEVEAEAVKN